VLISTLLSPSQKQCETNPSIGVDRGAKKAMPPQNLENIVILCFERRFSKQNSVIRLKSNILAPTNFFAPKNFLAPQSFWVGYATASNRDKKNAALFANRIS